jgi:tetratricopeptide (TPR) repeat protein
MPRIVFLFFLFFLFISSAYASDFDKNILKKAESFFGKKMYYKAETFYDAYLLENTSCKIKFKSGLCRYYTKRYEEALRIFDQISLSCNEKYQNPSYYMMYQIYLAMNEPGLGISELSNFEKFVSDTRLKNFAAYEKLWFYLRFGKNDQALNQIKKIDEDFKERFNISQIEKHIPYFDNKEKSPVLAGIFSIVPGGGYLYCKRYKDASFAFFVNSILAAASYEAFDNDLNVIGALTSVLTAGFYSGNIYGGIRAAEVENRLYRQRLYESVESRFRYQKDPEFKLEFKISF